MVQTATSCGLPSLLLIETEVWYDMIVDQSQIMIHHNSMAYPIMKALLRLLFHVMSSQDFHNAE